MSGPDAPALPPPPERLLDAEEEKTRVTLLVQATAIESTWNNLLGGADFASLNKMIQQCGGEGPAAAQLLIGRPIRCHGSTGLGDYGATVLEVDLEKGWIKVKWDDGSEPGWKTAKLCWMV